MSETLQPPDSSAARATEKDFDPVSEAKTLIRLARTAALATLDADGAPYASLINVGTDTDGTPVTLISRLARHTANLQRDPRASLLYSRLGAGDPQSHPRVSVSVVAEGAADERIRRRFLARHPDAQLYAEFADFSFVRLRPKGAHLVAGFGRIVDIAAADLVLDLSGTQELVEAEASAVAHMNADHLEALNLYATRLLGEPDGAWQAIGIDPEGLDLALGDRTARLPFAARLTSALDLRSALKELAHRARAGL